MSRLIGYLSSLDRQSKVAFQIGLDGALVVLSFLSAMYFRLDSLAFLAGPMIWQLVMVAVISGLAAFWFLGLYRTLVRFINGKILSVVGKGALIAATVLYLSNHFLSAYMPRSVPIIFAVFVFLSVGGSRFVARAVFRNPSQVSKRPVIIYGAGDSGMQLLNSLFHEREYLPIALVDDNPDLQDLGVGGLRVHPPARLPQLIRETGAQIVLLAIPSLSRARRKEIVQKLETLKIEIKTIPGLTEIINGTAKISELRAISAEDLLGRDPVAPVTDLLGRNITGRVVMVTGAGGSIGSELCRQILDQYPSVLVLFEISEFALYKIESELLAAKPAQEPTTRIVSVLGSIQNASRIQTTIVAHGVQTIYHAAAYKHVPLVEENIVEAIYNNVFGTLCVVEAAIKCGVEKLIMISTDKAVRPTNVMGATKRIAELICQAYAQTPTSTVISMVRFGNVLGSSGSVIPKFKDQIEAGGPVTVTHQEITRFFMTVSEASQLVIQAGAMGKGGDVFVLDMGDPVKILDVAMGMVRMHGLTPYLVTEPDKVLPEKGDIPVHITGLRKGEKLYEELLIGSNPQPTKHPRIMTASEMSLPLRELAPLLDQLSDECQRNDLDKIILILEKLPLHFNHLSQTTRD